jgi:hypothetical protein
MFFPDPDKSFGSDRRGSGSRLEPTTLSELCIASVVGPWPLIFKEKGQKAAGGLLITGEVICLNYAAFVLCSMLFELCT